MLVGGLNLIKKAIAERWPMPTGMGNWGFSEYACPVTLKGGGIEVELEADPLIAVGRKNEVVCRSVAKPQRDGTIKENWAVGDWNVTISGIIIAETEEELWQSVRQLQWICAVRESLEVTCPPLNEQYGIMRLAITELQLPFTPGLLNQQFNISAYSDESYELLEEL